MACHHIIEIVIGAIVQVAFGKIVGPANEPFKKCKNRWDDRAVFSAGVANLLKRECNRKKSQSCGGAAPRNTFITIKNTIYNTKSINVKLDAASVH